MRYAKFGFTPYRDAKFCGYCGRPFNDERPGSHRTKEHIIPKSMGYPNSSHGVIAACHECNRYRRDRTPDELRASALAFRNQADLLDTMADRIDELVDERGLQAPWLDKPSPH